MEKVIAIIRKSADTEDVYYQTKKINDFCERNDYHIERTITNDTMGIIGGREIDRTIKFAHEHGISRMVLIGISRLGNKALIIRQTIKTLNDAGIRLTCAETGMTIYISQDRTKYDERSLVLYNTLDEIITMEVLNEKDRKLKLTAQRTYYRDKKNKRKS